MKELIDVVEQIRLLPETFVDVGFGQGKDAILRQILKRDEYASTFIDAHIEGMKGDIALMLKSAQPHEIPQDYIFFLEEFGGLAINNEDFYLATLGIGPMVEEWYSSTCSDEAFKEVREYGFLSVGTLNFSVGDLRRKKIKFLFDLAGKVKKNSIIGIGPQKIDHFVVARDLYSYPDKWRKVADSFTNWLDMVVKTEGSFEYI